MKSNLFKYALCISLFFHLALIVLVVLYNNRQENLTFSSRYTAVEFKGGPFGVARAGGSAPQRKSILRGKMPSMASHKGDVITSSSEKITEKSDAEASNKTSLPGGYSNLSDGVFDSTGIGQYYSENSLNVRMKYPDGWTFLDQHLNNKLEGVTFYPEFSDIQPPPYIHVEVTDKYYFDQRKYKRYYKFDYFDGFYNDPEENANQVSQTIYIRTQDKYDYTIKLIIEGKDAFIGFQPAFFAIVNSFRFRM